MIHIKHTKCSDLTSHQLCETGSSVYGDTDYPDHVLRYYPFSGNTALYLKSGGILNLPIEGMTKAHITDYFGYRESPGGIGSTNHQGLDLGFPTGTPVYACESGTVTTANFNGGYGNCIVIDHGNGLQTLYGHLSEIGVTINQKVIRGQSIGRVGSTGNSTGPHLHLEVRVNGRAVDPLGVLNLN